MSDKLVGYLLLGGIVGVVSLLTVGIITSNRAIKIAENETKQMNELLQKSMFFGFGTKKGE